MSKKHVAIIASLAAALLVSAAVLRLGTGEDSWICQDGQWIIHGHPESAKPETPCGELILEEPKIVIESPQPNDLVSDPIALKGKARGYWFFEASFPVRLLDSSGQEVAVAIAQAQGDWMTEEYVDFAAEMEIPPAMSGPATLVFEKDNPSGLPEYDEEKEVSIVLPERADTTVKIFFNNGLLDPEITCAKVFPVERTVDSDDAIHAAMAELIEGPSEKEKEEGYFTNIGPDAEIKSLIIENGTARIDFKSHPDLQGGGSCRVSAIRSQIRQTLEQFPYVSGTIISVDGEVEEALQP